MKKSMLFLYNKKKYLLTFYIIFKQILLYQNNFQIIRSKLLITLFLIKNNNINKINIYNF